MTRLFSARLLYFSLFAENAIEDEELFGKMIKIFDQIITSYITCKRGKVL